MTPAQNTVQFGKLDFRWSDTIASGIPRSSFLSALRNRRKTMLGWLRRRSIDERFLEMIERQTVAIELQTEAFEKQAKAVQDANEAYLESLKLAGERTKEEILDLKKWQELALRMFSDSRKSANE